METLGLRNPFCQELTFLLLGLQIKQKVRPSSAPFLRWYGMRLTTPTPPGRPHLRMGIQ